MGRGVVSHSGRTLATDLPDFVDGSGGRAMAAWRRAGRSRSRFFDEALGSSCGWCGGAAMAALASVLTFGGSRDVGSPEPVAPAPAKARTAPRRRRAKATSARPPATSCASGCANRSRRRECRVAANARDHRRGGAAAARSLRGAQRRFRGGVSLRRTSTPTARSSSETAIASSIPVRSVASSTRRRSSCVTRATTIATA